MHGILVGRGNIAMTSLTDPAAVFLGRVFDHILMGLVLVLDIMAFMTVDTANFTVR